MGYSLDLKSISLQCYRELLRNQNLLPGRKILQQDLDSKFDAIQNTGINNLFELRNTLSTSHKLVLFSVKTHLSQEYLTILRREIGSMEQKPVPVKDFPGIDNDAIGNLNKIGIKTSKEYYDAYCLDKDLIMSAEKLRISVEVIKELNSMCELVRINGVGAVAARAFFEAGYKTVTEVANANAEEMLYKVTDVNLKKQYFRAKLGSKDMQFCIDFAQVIISFDKKRSDD